MCPSRFAGRLARVGSPACVGRLGLVFGQPFWCRVAPAVTSLVLSRYCERSAKVCSPSASLHWGSADPHPRRCAGMSRPAPLCAALADASRAPFPTSLAAMTTPGTPTISFGLHHLIASAARRVTFASVLRGSTCCETGAIDRIDPLIAEAAKRDVAGPPALLCSTHSGRHAASPRAQTQPSSAHAKHASRTPTARQSPPAPREHLSKSPRSH